MGFATNHTLLGGHLTDSKRKFHLGNSFSIPVICHLLRPLAKEGSEEPKAVVQQLKMDMYFNKP